MDSQVQTNDPREEALIAVDALRDGFGIAGTQLVRLAQSKPNLHLWDTREPEEWSGTKRLWGAKRAGPIPWIEWSRDPGQSDPERPLISGWVGGLCAGRA